MVGNNEIISYLQANNILALKLEHALSGVRKAVSSQLDAIGAKATRALYYVSCFTEEYQEVCQRQKREDIRFKNSVIKLFGKGNVAYDMLKIYFEEIFNYKSSGQLEHIKQMLMAVNIHIAANSLTKAGFALATATLVASAMILSLQFNILAGRRVAGTISAIGVYGIVQKAAESAHRLNIAYPAYYSALYAEELEMLYFLIEPVFLRAEAYKAQRGTESDLAEIITRLIR